MLRRYILYLIRWQLSTPILAPVVAYFKHSPSIFGTLEDWIGSCVANIIGGLIFFWVDRFIFSRRLDGPIWAVEENVECADCGTVTRGYRLIATRNYDRWKDPTPEFRCEACSAKKSQTLKEKGVVFE
ncbi:MAG TPA: hypothetical protein VHV83_12695 [Armatimonadota bacterium]|nr:hypothetical protein [Armatimonadota bacterium]